MTIDELRWFLVLAETQNATRAAELLHVTQPTLSRALRRLEREVGTALFDRHRQRLHLNSHGEIFRLHAQRAVREIARAGDQIAVQLGPLAGTVRLAFLHSFGTWLVPDLLGAFRSTDTEARFILRQDSADAVLAALIEDTADLALTSPRPAHPLVEWLMLQHERLDLVVPSDHHLAGHGPVRIADVANEDLVTMQPEFGLRQTIDGLFIRRGLIPRIVMESAEIATIRRLVANGLGVAIVPGGPHIPQNADLVSIELVDDDAYRPIGLCWHADRELSLTGRRFRQFVARHASGDEPWSGYAGPQ